MNFDFNSTFAEIEIDTSKNRSSFEKEALRLSAIPARPQPIQPREADPIRMRLYEMRRLASIRPFAKSDSELFYKQAKFMEDFSDDYNGSAKLNMYYPYYQNMGYEYLRTYFTWRTKIRNGDLQQISTSYIFLYLYELLSGIGVSDPADGLEKLLAIWKGYAESKPAIEKYLAKWLKDYCIFYQLPQSFFEVVSSNNLQEYYSLTFLFSDNVENKLETWNSLSGYNIENSKFYNDGNEELFCDCFNYVLEKIEEFCKERNMRFEDMLVYSVSKKLPWKPFEQALFQSRYKQADREVHISSFERYFCKSGEWTAVKPIFYSSQRDYIGYIIKKTEACLRKEVNYKYKLVADLKAGTKPFRELKRLSVKRAELDKVIERAVEEFYFNLNRTVVNVDLDNLMKIRSEALETQEQLIVPEESLHNEANDVKKMEWPEVNKPEQMDTDQVEPVAITMNFADGWGALKSALTDTEREALSIIMSGGNIKAFANEKGLMLEILIDSINEKAVDYIGDNIMEVDDEVYIYEEYMEYVHTLPVAPRP